MEITIKDLWNVLKKSFLFVVLGALVFGIAFGTYTSLAIAKVYQSSAKYILLSERTEMDKTPTVAELNNHFVVASKSIVTLSSYLMNEQTMTSVLRFIEQRHAQLPGDTEYVLDHRYTPASLMGLFTFVTPPEDETNIVFEVRCKAYSAKDSRLLLVAFGSIVNEHAKTVLQDVFRVETSAQPANGGQISPNLTVNTLLGAGIGALIPYAIFFVLSILDTRVKSEEDVKTRFKYPVLGQIPRL